MSSKCPHCGCSDIEIEPARGDAICTSCGTVLSDHNIVNEVQFLENSKGGSSAIGQFVSNDGKKSSFGRSYHGVFSRESREITLGNAYKRIKGLSQQLRLGSHYIETSFNFFKLALNKGLTKGRKYNLIIGACVYITCRTEATSHMLIDVSDALQIDVYELGRTYLKLSTALCITIPAMDPCLYILRFAHKLSFGDNTHEVSDTALRLVKRMKRDWMHTGRRPSGICGAALVIAARLHNFNRTITDVIKVVKVHESTLRKRLTEFGETPSSALTPEQFMTMDLEEEQDPPSFKLAKKKEKERVQLLLEQQKNLDTEFTEIQLEIEKHLENRRKKLRGIWAKYDKEQDSYNEKKENIVAQKFIAEATLKTIDQCLAENNEQVPNINIGIGPSAASLGLKSTIEECMEIRPSDPSTSKTEFLDFGGIDDDEIDIYIMSDREIKLKTELWMKVNEDYLKQLKEKEAREKEEAEQREKEGKPVKQKKVYKKRQKDTGPANTAGEAIEKMLQDKKLSNKINYDALRNLNGEKEDLEISENKTAKARQSAVLSSPEPIRKPEKIDSILLSLTGKHSRSSSSDNERLPKIKKLENGISTNKSLVDDSGKEVEEDEDDFDDEEDINNNNNDDDTLLNMLKKRMGENDSDDGEFD